MSGAKQLRYYVMLALYFPILLYAVSTFDLSESTYAVSEYQPVAVHDQTVVLGQEFQAKTFLAATRLTTPGSEDTASVTPQLVADGEVVASGDSMLTMSTDQLLEPGQDKRTVNFEASFEAEQLGGGTGRFPFSGRFTVRRPEIVATSVATQTLYRRCLNEIRLNVPGLENRPLYIESESGAVEGRTVTLSPAGEKTTVDVYLANDQSDDRVYLGEKTFSVIDPPRPQIRIFNAGREITNGDNLPLRRAALEIQVEPDAEFAQRHPEDANYQVEEAVVFVRQGLAASQQIGRFTLNDEGRLVLTGQLGNAKAGDQVTVRLEGIERINHNGQAVEVDLRESSRTFGFTLS